MKIRIIDKTKFIVRIIELIVVIVTIVLTVVSIKYANTMRDSKGYGGECLIPLIGFTIVLVVDDTYTEYEKQKKNKKGKK